MPACEALAHDPLLRRARADREGQGRGVATEDAPPQRCGIGVGQ
jgi:hypothetical protein